MKTYTVQIKETIQTNNKENAIDIFRHLLKERENNNEYTIITSKLNILQTIKNYLIK